MSFSDMLQRAKRGDAQALQDVLVEHLPRLQGFVRLRSPAHLRRRESCADLVQSVCRHAIDRIDTLRGESAPEFREWLDTIARNKIREKLQFHGAQKRDARREVEVPFDSHVDDEGLLRCYGHSLTPSRDLSTREEIERIERAFDRVPEEQREVLLLARFVGLSTPEIAERRGTSEMAVRKSLSRARARLAMLLSEPEEPPD